MMPAKRKRLVLILLGIALLSLVFSALSMAGVTQLLNDDGVFYQGSRAGRIRGDIDGAVFTPESAFFPLTIQSVEFALHRPRGADHIGDSARVRVQIYAVEEGVVGDLLIESAPQTFSGFDQWFSVPLSQPVTMETPASFMAAVKWESGSENEPAPSIATDSNLDAPQTLKDQKNIFHDANIVLRPSACQDEFCAHSQFWGDPELVGFNMIRVTVDTPQQPTKTPTKPAPTATATPTVVPLPTPSQPRVYLPTVLRDFLASMHVVRVGSVPGEAVSYTLTSGAKLAGLCWPGVNNNLWVGSEPDSERGIMRSVIRFNLDPLPTDAVLVNAELRLVAVEAGGSDAPMAITIHDISRPWTGCPTWNTLGGAVGQAWATFDVGSEIEQYTVDVTALVQRWMTGNLPNNGLMLRGDEGGSGWVRGFVPTASSQEDLRPSLVIRYSRH